MARAIYTNDYDYYKHFKSNDLGVKYELEYTKIKDSVLIMKELPEDNMESSNTYIVAGPNVGKHYLKQYRLMEDVSNCIFLGDAVFESVPVPSNYISSPINWYLWYHNLYEYQTLQDRCSHAIDSMQNFLSNPIDYKTLQRTVEHNQTNLKKIQKFSYMDRLTTRIKRVFNTNPKLTF